MEKVPSVVVTHFDGVVCFAGCDWRVLAAAGGLCGDARKQGEKQRGCCQRRERKHVEEIRIRMKV